MKTAVICFFILIGCAEDQQTSRHSVSGDLPDSGQTKSSDDYSGLDLFNASSKSKQTTETIQGFFRFADCQSLQGWAELSTEKGMPFKRTPSKIKIQIWADGLPGQGGSKVAEADASETLTSLPAKARRAFAVATPRTLMTGRPRDLYAIAALDETGDSLQLLRWSNNKSDLQPFVINCIPPEDMSGSLSYVTADLLKGWAKSESSGSEPVRIEMWVGGLPGIGTLEATTKANKTIDEYRVRKPELAGRAFEIKIPDSIRDGLDHDIYVVGRYPDKSSAYTLLMLYSNGEESGRRLSWPLQLNRQQFKNEQVEGSYGLKIARRQAGDPNGRLKNYKLVWHDEFNDPNIDTKKWVFRTGCNEFTEEKDTLRKSVATCNTKENVVVRDGNLVVQLRKQKSDFDKIVEGVKVQKTAEYTGGGVVSIERFKEGYFEARVKVPAKRGWHTSFWTIYSENYGLPAAAAADRISVLGDHLELDFMEHTSSQKTIFTNNLHRWRLNGVALPYEKHIVKYNGLVGSEYETNKVLSDKYYIFGGEITESKMRVYFDGYLIDEIDLTVDSKGNKMTNNLQNLFLTSLAFLKDYDDSVDEKLLKKSDKTLIEEAYFDWVRVYKLK